MFNLIRRFSLIVITSLLWSSLQAEELQFTLSKNIDLLTEKDAALFHDMVELALDSQPDGYVLSWENPESGANGTLQIAGTDNSDAYCREVALVRHAKGVTEQSSMQFCRQANNQWVKK
ncbi:MAG: RT0821/Lpp0805 family surface protein [Gammaproteobacteria bacterium]|nr:RT0821/Lpp0805 family surface protein [Gammaproteobacteria bacterium]